MNEGNQLGVPRTEFNFQVNEAGVNEENNEEEGVNDREAAQQLVKRGDDIEARDHKDCLQKAVGVGMGSASFDSSIKSQNNITYHNVGNYSKDAETCEKDTLQSFN